MNKFLLILCVIGAVLSSPARAQLSGDKIVLAGKDATFTGDVKWDDKELCIAYWKGVGSTATWKLPPGTVGTYAVAITYSLKPKGPNFVREFLISTESDSHKIVGLKDTGGWNNFVTKTTLSLNISMADKTFTITALKVPPDYALMNLQSVTLTKGL